MSKETNISRKSIFQGRAVRLRVDTVRMPSGRETTREIVEHDDAIAVVALDNEDKILMVKQYRTAVGKELLEIPAGGIDPGEDPETAVRREMREETGYLPQKLVKLGGFYSAPGYSTEFLYLYLVSDLVLSPLNAEDTELIKLVRVDVNEIRDMIVSGQICDGKSVAGLLYYREFRKGR